MPVADGRIDKIRILFLGSNPDGTPDLDLDQDWDGIRRAVDIGERHRDVLLKALWAPSVDTLFDEINVFKPHVLHFSGHGARREGLFFTDPDGEPDAVSEDTLTRLLRSVREEGLDLVVLAACRSLPLARAAVRFVKCAVGVEAELDDDDACRFIRGFYGGLATGRSVAAAFDQGEGRVRAIAGIPGRHRFRLEFNARVDPNDVFLGGRRPAQRASLENVTVGQPGNDVPGRAAKDAGLRFLDLRLHGEAVARFREATVAGRPDAEAHYYLALAMLRGRRPQAIETIERAQAIEQQLRMAVTLPEPRAEYFYLWAWLKHDFFDRNGVYAGMPPKPQEIIAKAQALPLDRQAALRLRANVPDDAPHDAIIATLDKHLISYR